MAKLQFTSKYIKAPDTNFNEWGIGLKFGAEEVIELQRVSASFELSGNDQYLRLFFHRRSPKGEERDISPETGDMMMDGSDTFWSCAHFQYMVTSGIHNRSALKQIYFPTPLLLLREPRIVGKGSSGASAYLFFYYIKRKATKEEIARLMVKAHS